MRRRSKILLTLLLVIGAILLASTPPRLDYSPQLGADVDLQALLREHEDHLIPGTEKRVLWHDKERRTEWSVVALHGFSASRQESAPLAELVARELGANLFETRFAKHGLVENALVDVTAEDWLDDVAEALQAGHLLGEKIVVIAVSNGATLALSMLDHPAMQPVDSLIMLSPNLAPADPKAMWITGPGGALLLRLISGDTRSWEAHNARQERFWTTSYPSKTLIQVMRVVDRAIGRVETAPAPRVQVFYAPNDAVISAPALLAAYDRLQSPQKELVKILETGAPSAHILAGDIISPDNTVPVAEKITAFVRRPKP